MVHPLAGLRTSTTIIAGAIALCACSLRDVDQYGTPGETSSNGGAGATDAGMSGSAGWAPGSGGAGGTGGAGGPGGTGGAASGGEGNGGSTWGGGGTGGASGAGGASGSSGSGGVYSITDLATAQDQPWGIAIGGSYVYWTNGAASGGVYRVPIGSPGARETIAAPTSSARSLVLANKYLFFLQSGGLMRVSTSGGAVSNVNQSADSSGGLAAAHDDETGADYVFFISTSGTVQRHKVGAGQGNFADIAGAGQLATDGATLYVTTSSPGEVWSVPVLDGSAPTLLTTASLAKAVAADATTVFFAAGGWIRAVANTGGPSQQIVAADPWALVVDATRVYFKDGFVSSTDKSGLGKKQYAPIAANDPGQMTTDATRIFWADTNGGKIRSAVK